MPSAFKPLKGRHMFSPLFENLKKSYYCKETILRDSFIIFFFSQQTSNDREFKWNKDQVLRETSALIQSFTY